MNPNDASQATTMPPAQTAESSQGMQPVQPAQQGGEMPQPSAKSSKILMLTLIFIIALIILGIVLYMKSANSLSYIKGASNTSLLQRQNQVRTNRLIPEPTPATQEERDMRNIDTDLGSTAANLSSIDQAMNDQSLDLSE